MTSIFWLDVKIRKSYFMLVYPNNLELSVQLSIFIIFRGWVKNIRRKNSTIIWHFSKISNWMTPKGDSKSAGKMDPWPICVHYQCEKKKFKNFVFLRYILHSYFKNYVMKVFLAQKMDFLKFLIFPIDLTQWSILPAVQVRWTLLRWRHFDVIAATGTRKQQNNACFINPKG